MGLRVLNNLKNPANLIVSVGIFAIFFSVNYYFMSRLPGEVNFTCVPRGALTPTNLIFGVIISVLTAVMIVGLVTLYKEKTKSLRRHSVAGITGIGVVIGTFTVFCTACTIPVVSLFGFSVGLSFFTDYNLTFKVISLTLMVIGIYFLERQLRDECLICKN